MFWVIDQVFSVILHKAGKRNAPMFISWLSNGENNNCMWFSNCYEYHQKIRSKTDMHYQLIISYQSTFLVIWCLQPSEIDTIYVSNEQQSETDAVSCRINTSWSIFFQLQKDKFQRTNYYQCRCTLISLFGLNWLRAMNDSTVCTYYDDYVK